MKRLGFCSLLFAILGSVFMAMLSVEDVNAYLTDECFAIEYKVTPNSSTIDKEGNEKANTRVLSTNKICLNTKDKKKLRTSPNLPSNAAGRLDMPALEATDTGDGAKFAYCSNGANTLFMGLWCYGALAEDETMIDVKNGNAGGEYVSKEYKFSDYDYDIKKLAKAINNEVANLGGTDNSTSGKFEILALTDNTTKGEEGEIINEGGNGGKDNNKEETGSVEETCANQGGAQSLGWIVCPILTWIGNASDELYNKYVEPSLQIDPKLFTSTDSGLEEAWGTFQSIANIIFVILLLIVIFSQLTGVGIDNYGIKKILPKLIVSAILINLSYIICMIAIDLSNILGNGFQALFNGLSQDLTSNMASSINIEGTDVDLAPASGTLASVGVLGAIVLATGAMWANPAIILSVFVSALGVFISVIFLFVILATREAAVIVLVVISPVALVCYMLPNTKKMFDKWYKAFEGLLLLYPICGLLVGGGNYVARLLLTSGFANSGFIAAFTSMIAGIVPVFFIPLLTRNAFSSLGNLGARIAGVGQQLGGRTTNMVRSSGAYKNSQQAGLERQTRIRGGLDAEGNPVDGWRRRLGTVMSGGRRSRQRNALQYQKMLSERGSLEATEGEDFMLATQTANVLKGLEADGTINDSNALETGLTGALVSGNRAEIRAYTDALSAKGESGRDAVRRSYNAAAGRMSQGSAETFAANIMANHAADYKNNSRSMFNIARDINSGDMTRGQNGFQTTNDYSQAHTVELQSAAKAETMGGMDDSAFAEAFLGGANYSTNGQIDTRNINLSGLNAEQLDAVGSNAYNALQNTTGMNANRVAYLQEIVNRTGYTPPTQNVHNV